MVLTVPGFRRSWILSESKRTKRSNLSAFCIHDLIPYATFRGLTLRLLLHPAVNLCPGSLRRPDEIDGLQIGFVELLRGIEELLQTKEALTNWACNLIRMRRPPPENSQIGSGKSFRHKGDWPASGCTTRRVNWCLCWEFGSLHGRFHQNWTTEPGRRISQLLFWNGND